MAGFTRRLTIDAPPSRVFAVLTDLDQAPQWMPAIQKTEWVEGTTVAPGAKWKETRVEGKRTMVSDLNVAAYEKDKQLDLHVHSKPFEMDLGFKLAKQGTGTLVDYHCDGHGRGLMRLMTKPIMRMVEKQDDDLLLRLKAQCEAKAAPAKAAPRPPSKASKKR
jgi:carbon monoxide dehydrogenase subunit G